MDTLYQSLVSVEPFTLVVTILNLFLQLYLIKKLFLGKVIAVLDARREHADKQIRGAEEAKQEAEQIRQGYAAQMMQVEQEAAQILRTAQETATVHSEQMIRQAQKQAVQIKEKASADVEQIKRKAINEVKNEISDMVMIIAGKVVGRTLNRQDQNHLVDAVIRELGDDV